MPVRVPPKIHLGFLTGIPQGSPLEAHQEITSMISSEISSMLSLRVLLGISSVATAEIFSRILTRTSTIIFAEISRPFSAGKCPLIVLERPPVITAGFPAGITRETQKNHYEEFLP